jgi:hypothetical protein
MRQDMVVPVAFLLCAVISAANAQGYLAGLPNEPSSTGTNRIIKTFQFPATMMVSGKKRNMPKGAPINLISSSFSSDSI